MGFTSIKMMKLGRLMLVCLIAVVAQALPGTYLIETADEKGEDNVAPLGRDYHNVSQFGGGWGHHNVVQFGRDYSGVPAAPAAEGKAASGEDYHNVVQFGKK